MEQKKSGKGKVIGIIAAIVIVLGGVFCWFSGLVGGISADEARVIAYSQVPGAVDDGTAVVVKEFEGLRMVYEVQFVYDGILYEFQIVARNGRVLEQEFEGSMSQTQPTLGDDSTEPSTVQQDQAQTAPADIGMDKAKEIALGQVPGATANDIISVLTDSENGKLIYEVEIRYDGKEYDFDIDAATGSIVSSSQESVLD